MLSWNEDGEHFVLADTDGKVEIWQMSDGIVSSWKCIARETVDKESFIAAKFVAKRRRVS